jgi:hypothetical protein
MAAKSRKGANAMLLDSRPKAGGKEKPLAVYKFSKRGQNRGPVLESEKRDRSTYDYSDEM